MFDDFDVFPNYDLVQLQLKKFVTKQGSDKKSINDLTKLGKEDFWQKLPDIIDPVFKIPGVKHLEKKKYYSSSQILASQSYCLVDAKHKTLLECNNLVEVLYKKPYQFDPLISKLMDTVAVLFLHHDIKIFFSNNFQVLDNAGYVENARISGVDQKIVVSINPSLSFMKTNLNSKTVSGLDDVYHQVFNVFSKYVNAYNPNVFYQKQYDQAVSATLNNLGNDNKNGNLGWFNWFGIKKPTKICEFVLQTQLSKEDFYKNFDSAYIKKHFFQVCQNKKFDSVYADVYGLIVDGLETDKGVKHHKLAYLQPMVSFVKDYFEPSHVLYQNRLCASNKVLECHRSGDVMIFSIFGLEGLEEVMLRGTVIDE